LRHGWAPNASDKVVAFGTRRVIPINLVGASVWVLLQSSLHIESDT